MTTRGQRGGHAVRRAIETVAPGSEIRFEDEDMFVVFEEVSAIPHEPDLVNVWVVGDKLPTRMRKGQLIDVREGPFTTENHTRQEPHVIFVLLTDDDNSTMLVACPDGDAADQVGEAAIFNDGDVSAWEVPVRAVTDTETVARILNEGGHISDLHGANLPTTPVWPLTPEEAAELERLEAEFEAAGGRGVELAERIDALRAKRP